MGTETVVSERSRGDPETEISSPEELDARRHYTLGELEVLRGLWFAIAQVREHQIGFIREVNAKVSSTRGTGHGYECRRERPNIADPRETEKSPQNPSGDPSAGSDTAGTSPPTESKSGPAFSCMNLEMVFSVNRLLGCVAAEIAKGNNTSTEAFFYSSVFKLMSLTVETVESLNSVYMKCVLSSYDTTTPSTGDLEN